MKYMNNLKFKDFQYKKSSILKPKKCAPLENDAIQKNGYQISCIVTTKISKLEMGCSNICTQAR